jgi:protein-tyrosine kinase
MNIPASSVEVDRIYTQLSSQDIRSVAITAAKSGEGVSSIALALAQRCLFAGHSTLLVDLNIYHPSLEHVLRINEQQSNFGLLDQPQLMSIANTSIVVTGVAAPSQRDVTMRLRQQGVLENCIEKWLRSYDRVIIDTSPINRVNASNIPTERIAAACDACLVVVLAGNTTEAMVVSVIDKLTNASVRVLGCIFNDRDNPTLKDELIRETRRLRPKFNTLADRLENWLRKNRLLSLDV